MALIECKECKTQISNTTKNCPKCGAKVPPRTALLTWIAGGVVAVMMFSCIGSMTKSEDARQIAQAKKAEAEAAKSPQQKASEAAAAKRSEDEFQFGVMATKLVRASLKNPASFEFVQAGIVDRGALCLTYRATNSFNAIITEQVAITRKLTKGDWNKECGGKSMPSFNYIKQAI
jgi:hypothetical protein